MRVISGKYKGRRLKALDNKDIRPTSDMLKEAIFNILQPFISDAVVLDLFAGSGALGIEALSRGASFAVFNDKNPDAVRVLKENLKFVSENNFEVHFGDYKSALSRCRDMKFDIIFLDPPYESDYYNFAIEIAANGMLNEGGLIIAEHDAKRVLNGLPQNILIKSERKYGSRGITVLEYKEAGQ